MYKLEKQGRFFNLYEVTNGQMGSWPCASTNPYLSPGLCLSEPELDFSESSIIEVTAKFAEKTYFVKPIK